MNYILRLQVPRLNGAHRAQLDVVVQNSKSYFAQPSLVDVQLHALYVFENEIWFIKVNQLKNPCSHFLIVISTNYRCTLVSAISVLQLDTIQLLNKIPRIQHPGTICGQHFVFVGCLKKEIVILRSVSLFGKNFRDEIIKLRISLLKILKVTANSSDFKFRNKNRKY